ncbi:hypothetical protein [Roseomonas chloroacetimidivorans]|uniref:hypothetical protein n=1 Tax=Roseomonas chloroacetimidivorans TaxID=1766656 RepID=UPI003C77F475
MDMTTGFSLDMSALERACRKAIELQLAAIPDPADHATALERIRNQLTLVLQHAPLGPDPVGEIIQRARLAATLEETIQTMLAARHAER